MPASFVNRNQPRPSINFYGTAEDSLVAQSQPGYYGRSGNPSSGGLVQRSQQQESEGTEIGPDDMKDIYDKGKEAYELFQGGEGAVDFSGSKVATSQTQYPTNLTQGNPSTSYQPGGDPGVDIAADGVAHPPPQPTGGPAMAAPASGAPATEAIATKMIADSGIVAVSSAAQASAVSVAMAGGTAGEVAAAAAGSQMVSGGAIMGAPLAGSAAPAAGAALSGAGLAMGIGAAVVVAVVVGKGMYDQISGSFKKSADRTRNKKIYRSTGGVALSDKNIIQHPTLGQGHIWTDPKTKNNFFVTSQDAAPLRAVFQPGGLDSIAAKGHTQTLAFHLDSDMTPLRMGTFSDDGFGFVDEGFQPVGGDQRSGFAKLGEYKISGHSPGGFAKIDFGDDAYQETPVGSLDAAAWREQNPRGQALLDKRHRIKQAQLPTEEERKAESRRKQEAAI